MEKVLKTLYSIPFLGKYVQVIVKTSVKTVFPGSLEYWERRYALGGNSGPGSYGDLSTFKTEIINSFVLCKKINSVLDFGCGNGDQIQYFNIPKYFGLDVSKTAINKCINTFKDDKSKSFFIYDPHCFQDNHNLFNAELVLSLDVIFHIVEEPLYEMYMKHVFQSSSKYVIIYSSNTQINSPLQSPNVYRRQFTTFIRNNYSEWFLIKKIPNKFPHLSKSSFFIYEKRNK